MSSCVPIDNSFGPRAGQCRGGFDFTLLFEESILTIPLVVLLLLVTPFRLLYLLRRRPKVEGSALLYWKLVRPCLDLSFALHIHVKSESSLADPGPQIFRKV